MPYLLDQLLEALSADPAGGDLRLHVSDDELCGPHVVAQEAPDPLVAPALLLDLDRVELEALGVRVGRVDDPARARCQRAEIEVVGGGRRVGDELAAVEDGDDEADVGLVRRAVVGVVVDDDVARPPLLADLGKASVDAADVAGERAGLQRRGLRRLRELPRLGVADHAAEVLGLADDRRVGHPRQLVAHLDRDRLQRARDHRGGDRVDPSGGRRAHLLRIRLPEASARAVQPGGTTVVASRWKTTAAPSIDSPTGRRERS